MSIERSEGFVPTTEDPQQEATEEYIDTTGQQDIDISPVATQLAVMVVEENLREGKSIRIAGTNIVLRKVQPNGPLNEGVESRLPNEQADSKRSV